MRQERKNQIKMLLVGAILIAIVSVLLNWGIKFYNQRQSEQLQKDSLAQWKEQSLHDYLRKVDNRLEKLEWNQRLIQNDLDDIKSQKAQAAVLSNPNNDLPNTAQEAFNKGLVFLTHDLYDRAIIQFDQAIKLDPEFASAYDNLGNAYFFKGDYENAILNFDKAIELMPNNSPTYDFRARSYFKIGEFDKAWEDVHKASELGHILDPKFIEALKKYSGTNATNWVNPEKMLQEAKYNADREDYKNLPIEWHACKEDSDCALGGLECQLVPINKNYIKAPIRTVQATFLDNSCSNIRNTRERVDVVCIKNKCELQEDKK